VSKSGPFDETGSVHGREGMLSVGELRSAIDTHSIHTVLLVLVDMQGRLQGKRCAARYFMEEVLPHGAEACNYLLAVDVEMNTVDGYALTSWEQGYGDFELVPDFSTLRRVPWQSGTALVFADLRLTTGEPVRPSPRQVLQRQRSGSPSAAGTRCQVPSWSSSSTATPTRRPGGPATATSPRPTCTTSTTRSSAPRGSSRCCTQSLRA